MGKLIVLDGSNQRGDPVLLSAFWYGLPTDEVKFEIFSLKLINYLSLAIRDLFRLAYQSALFTLHA
jgi:hypothetical protein